MNSRQKLVQKQFLNNEEAVIKRLNQVYGVALNDITSKIEHLQLSIDGLQLEYDWMDPDDPKRAQVKSMIQSKIYQKNYQEALQGQVEGILNQMKTKQFLTVSDYLNTCYEDGFVGSIFDLHGQGVPMMMPLDQTKMVRAVQLDSKISKGLYTRLGEDVDLLKKKITAQVSRSISTGASYAQTAKQLAGYTRIGYNNAVRIARTEGHRIQCNAAMDVMEAAKAKGADVVKQWDATLDDRTREEHVALDGEIREVDEPFSNGLMFPGDPAGEAADVINCRCALLQRARWAVKESMDPETGELIRTEGAFSKFDRESGKIVDFKDSDDYNTFKKKYLKAVNEPEAAVPVVSGLDACTTVAEVETLLKSQGWFNVQTINGKVYDSNEGCTLAGVDLECAKSIYTTHEKLFTKYPQLVGKLNGVNAQALSPMTYAQCHVGLGHGGITVNTYHFGDVGKLITRYQRDLASGFHPLGTTYDSIVMHELGHAVDDYLTNTLYLAGMKNHWQPKWVSADLRPKVMRSCGMKVADAGKEVSGYATKNHYEWFAECFCEYMDSPTPRAVATEFGKRFEELMEKVK